MATTIQRGLTREADFQTLLDSIGPSIELKWGKGLSSEEVREKEPFKTLFSALEGIAEIVTPTISLLSTIVEALASVVDILSLALGIAVDIFEGFILALNVLIKQVIQLFEGTSVSLMFHAPLSPKERRKPSEILYDVGMSYLDQGDKNRPIAPTRSVYGAAIVSMLTVPNPSILIDKFNAIRDLVQKGQNDVASTLTGITKKTPSTTSVKSASFVLNGTSGLAPDWMTSLSFKDMGPFGDITSALSKLLTTINSSRSATQKINAAINVVRLRLSRIQNTINSVLAAYQLALQLFAFGEGSNLFLVAGNGNSQDFARSIINAPNHPDYPKASLSERAYGNFSDNKQQARALGESALFSGAFVMHLQVGAGGGEGAVNLIESLINAIIAPVATNFTRADTDIASTQDIQGIRDAAGNLKSIYKSAAKAKNQLD